MYHPTTRALTILELLQAHPQLSGAELAERLEVDRRTVRRYVLMLQDMGIPIDAERGPYGGYRLRPGFKMPPLMLSDDEALAITLSLIVAHTQGIAVEPHNIAGALSKIERVLPDSLRSRLQSVRTSVAFTQPSPVARADSTIFLTTSTAIQQRQRLWIVYVSGSGRTERGFDPYGLVHHWERWYVVGWCHLRAEVRVFRVDRIIAATLQDISFEPPADFDSLASVHRALATTPWGWEAEVLLETTLEQARQQILPGVALLDACEGGVLLRAYVDNLDWLAWRLLALPFNCTVRRPSELKRALETVAERALAMARR